MGSLCKCCVAGLGASLATVAAAATYYSTETSAAGVVQNGAVISDATKLKTAEGDSPDAATWGLVPCDDTVDLGTSCDTSRRVVFQVSSTGGSVTRYLGKIVGDKRIEMDLMRSKKTDSFDPVKFVIRDPNDFKGAWRVSSPCGTMVFENDETFTPRLERLETQTYTTLNVTNPAGRVCVGLLRAAKETETHNNGNMPAYTNGTNAAHGWGALEKTGPGTLEIEASSGTRGHVYVMKGAIELKGQPKPTRTLEAILAEAWMHLDPSRADTLKTYQDADGRTCVTNWSSVTGTQAAHFPSKAEFDSYWKPDGLTYAELNPPFIGSARSSSGLPMMDFGSTTASMVPRTGPLYGMMMFPECAHVREVFYVRHFTQDSTAVAYNSIIGHTSDYPLHPDGLDGLFSTAASASVRNGTIHVNGAKACWWDYPADAYTRGWGQPFLLNVATTGDIRLNLLGCERLFRARTGGCRLGEVIIFTRTLTEAERRQVNEYLMKKWFKDYQACDVEAVSLAKGTSICVPAGRVARIDRLSVGGGTLVKTGEGHLQVGEIEPANATIDVQGGSVDAGEGSGAVTDDAPAASPVLWLDAQDRSSMVVSNDTESGSTFLLRWNDRAGGANFASVQPIGAVTNWPRVMAASGVSGSGEIVDFGAAKGAKKDVTAAVGGASYVKFNFSNDQQRPHTAFLVIRFKDSSLWGNKFDTTSFSLINNASVTAASLLNRNYTVAKAGTASWTRNGGSENPYATRSGFTASATAPLEVLSFAAGDYLPFDLLASDRAMQGFGGKQVAEVILYNRALTLAERRQTEAYLMKRWKSAAHPAASGSAWHAAASSDPVVIARDEDATFATVEGGSRDYVKTGTGDVTIAPTLADRADAPSSLTVLRGSFTVDYQYPVKPLFRFDATSADSFFDTVEEGGKTYVATWRDADARAVEAVSYIGDHSVAKGYLNDVETAPGVTRRMLNCGDGNAALTSASPSAGYRMSTKFTTVREALAVEADTEGSSQSLFSSSDNSIHYLRGWGKFRQLIQNYGTAQIMVTNGYIAVDGTERPYTYVLPSGVHLIHFGPTANTTIDTIAHDRNVTAGGLQVGEQLAFAENLTASRRAYLTQGLLYKWFEKGERPTWTNTVTSILLDNGATLALNASDTYGDTALAVRELAGWGHVGMADGMSLADVTNVVGSAAGVLSVAGDVTLAEGCAVSIVGDQPLTVAGTLTLPKAAKIVLDAAPLNLPYAGGTVTLMSATALAGAEDISGWSLAVSGARRGLVWEMKRTATAVIATANPRGALILLR